MDGRQGKKIENERPIAKPSFPLPTIFKNRGVRSESPTLRQKRERAHFYKKQAHKSGTPTYGFFISTEAVESKPHNQ